ncbi:hypothetical protein GW17_00038012, partial [Ensete ventricosum]
VVLGVIAVLAIIACVAGRLCARLLSDPKSGSRRRHHPRAVKDNDIEDGLEFDIPTLKPASKVANHRDAQPSGGVAAKNAAAGVSKGATHPASSIQANNKPSPGLALETLLCRYWAKACWAKYDLHLTRVPPRRSCGAPFGITKPSSPSIRGFPPQPTSTTWFRPANGPVVVVLLVGRLLIEEAEQIWDQEVECYRPLGLGGFMFMVGVSDMVVLGSAISLQALNAQAYTSEFTVSIAYACSQILVRISIRPTV